METIHSAAPVVLRRVTDLWQGARVGGEYRYLPFRKEILWLRVASAEVCLRYNGELLKEVSGWHDCGYGFMSSVETALKEAQKLAKRLGIVCGDKLRVDIDVKVEDVPVLEDESDEGRRWNAEHPKGKWQQRYVRVPTGMSDDGPWYLSPGSDVGGGYPRLEAVEIVTREAAYSSNGVNMQTADDLKRWIEEQRAIAAKSAEAERAGTA
jgi:hypothetical protein